MISLDLLPCHIEEDVYLLNGGSKSFHILCFCNIKNSSFNACKKNIKKHDKTLCFSLQYETYCGQNISFNIIYMVHKLSLQTIVLSLQASYNKKEKSRFSSYCRNSFSPNNIHAITISEPCILPVFCNVIQEVGYNLNIFLIVIFIHLYIYIYTFTQMRISFVNCSSWFKNILLIVLIHV